MAAPDTSTAGGSFIDSVMANKRKIYVGNLDKSATVNEIHELFGFINPVLQQSCDVTMHTKDGGDCYALLEVPDNFVNGILK